MCRHINWAGNHVYELFAANGFVTNSNRETEWEIEYQKVGLYIAYLRLLIRQNIISPGYFGKPLRGLVAIV